MTIAQANVVLSLDEDGAGLYAPTELRGYFRVDARHRRRLFRMADRAAYVHQNGHNDPLSVALVIDTIMRMKPSEEMRARFFTALLTQVHPRVRWDAITVGKILGEISEMASQRFGRNEAIVKQRRDRYGFWWTLKPTHDTWAWLLMLLDHAWKKFEERDEQLRETGRYRLITSVFSDLPEAMGLDRIVA